MEPTIPASETLPDDVVDTIFEYLESAEDIVPVMLVSLQWRRCDAKDGIWGRLFTKYWEFTPNLGAEMRCEHFFAFTIQNAAHHASTL